MSPNTCPCPAGAGPAAAGAQGLTPDSAAYEQYKRALAAQYRAAQQPAQVYNVNPYQYNAPIDATGGVVPREGPHAVQPAGAGGGTGGLAAHQPVSLRGAVPTPEQQLQLLQQIQAGAPYQQDRYRA